jgi:hypothetical protein
MKKTSLVKSALLVATGSLLLTGCVVREREVRYRNPPPPPPPPAPGVAVETPGVEVDVTGPPPTDIVEVQPIMPGPDFIWVGGYWGWGPRGWVWSHGYWGHPPRRGAVWLRPHYVYRGGRHVWVRGGWR